MNETDRIVKQLLALGYWSERSAVVATRAEFKCEYCDLEFYATPENYKLWETDHIVPRRRRADADNLENLAAACLVCNSKFKGQFDPRIEAGSNATREQLIAAVRQYIVEQKQKFTQSTMAPEIAAIKAGRVA